MTKDELPIWLIRVKGTGRDARAATLNVRAPDRNAAYAATTKKHPTLTILGIRRSRRGPNASARPPARTTS